MIERTRRGARRSIVALVCCLALGSGMIPFAPDAAATPPMATAPPGIYTTLVSAPSSVRPGTPVTVIARVENTTTGPLTNPVASLRVESRSAVTRNALDNWASAGPSTRPGSLVTQRSLNTIAPGASQQVSFTVPAADLGIASARDWGPRGIAVFVATGGTSVSVLRTFVVASPTGSVKPVSLSIAAAITGPPAVLDEEKDDTAVTAATSRAGHLGRVLAATADAPEVSWVVDPATVARTELSSTTATKDWAAALIAATKDRSVFALPAYDPDLGAYAHSPTTPLVRTPVPGGSEPTTSWRTDLAWPAATTPDDATVAFAVAQASPYVIVGAGLAPDESLTYTPTGLAHPKSVPTSTAVIADDVLSTELAGPSSADVAAATSPAQETQRLLAETAAIVRERPAAARHLLAALPRDWDPDPVTFQTKMAALRSVPWVNLTPLDQLLAAPVPDLPRSPLPAHTPDPQEITPATLTDLARDRQRLTAFAGVVAQPSGIVRPLESAFAAPAAVAYRSEPAARLATVRQARAETARVVSSISIGPLSDVNLLGERMELALPLHNALPQDATVQLILRPDDGRLQILENPTVVIPADGSVAAKVPVRAIGTGNVTVTVSVTQPAGPTGGGAPVARPANLEVRVRATWESIGANVGIAVIALLLAAGIWRTVRRGRSNRRAPDAEIAGEHESDWSAVGEPAGNVAAGPDGPRVSQEDR